MAERQIVVLIVAGSSPVPHPCLAFVAQLDRAPDFESVGRRFESSGPLAQLVEQQTLNLWVKGSIPLRLIRGNGEIGRHAGFRIRYREV